MLQTCFTLPGPLSGHVSKRNNWGGGEHTVTRGFMGKNVFLFYMFYEKPQTSNHLIICRSELSRRRGGELRPPLLTIQNYRPVNKVYEKCNTRAQKNADM